MHPLTFIHITDTHLNAPHNGSFLQLETIQQLQEVFRQVQAMAFKPTFVVVSGDLSHEGNSDDYRFIKDLFDQASQTLGVPILVALGNHDHRAPFNEGYLGISGSDAAYYYAREFEGLRLIVLDSHWDGHHAGRLSEEQLAWLKQQLETRAPRGTVIVVHHPPHLNSLSGLTGQTLVNAAEFVEVVAGSDVIAILSGHVHMVSASTVGSVLSVTSQGTAFGLDPLVTTGMRIIEAYGYNLCLVSNDELIVQPFDLSSSRREVFYMSREQLTAVIHDFTQDSNAEL